MEDTYPEGFTRVSFSGAGCQLSALIGGDPDGIPLVMLHGMKDHAASMLRMARHFRHCRLVLLDFRGHGDSDNPGSYSMLDYQADLYLLFRHFDLDHVVLVAHSLGGHIAVRYASLYPDQIRQLVILDGLGPPRFPDLTDLTMQAFRHEQWRNHIESHAEKGTRPELLKHKVMPSIADAAARLMRNSPRLSADHAQFIAREGVQAVNDGYVWKWDKRVDLIWSTFSHDENHASLGSITCPVLLVTGEFGLDYWAAMREGLKGQHSYYEAELIYKEQRFTNARSVVVPGAGHMLHYDQPARVATQMDSFIEC